MDAFASPSTRAPAARHASAGGWELTGVTLAVGLGLMAFPGAPNVELDSSWQVMLIHAHAAGLQFGRDFIFTWGPWGFLCSRYALGATCAGALATWVIGGSFLLAGVLALLTRAEPPLRRILLALTVVAVNWLFQDTVYFVVILLLGVRALMDPSARGWALGLAVLILGFLGQLKFTYLVLAAAMVAAAMGAALQRRAWARAAGIGGGFAGSVLAAWMAAGQNPDNLYPYLRRSLDIAAGYGGAMQFDESWLVFGDGLVVVLAALALCWRWARLGSDRLGSPWAAVALAISVLVMWKEAYTRADLVTTGGHVLGLFTYLVIVIPALGTAMGGLPRPAGVPVTWLLAWAGLAVADPGFFAVAPRVVWQRYYGAIQGLKRARHSAEDWEVLFRAAAAGAALPAIQAAVGRGTADAYSFSDATLLMNGLALSTRPIIQSYSAYSPSLEGWNLRFYQSARAPDFLLWNEERVDDRYPGEDDAMLVGALPGHYVPELTEGSTLLLRRTSPLAAAPPAHRLLVEGSVRLAQAVDLPPFGGHPLWLQVNAVPNLLGRLRGLLYKPAILTLRTTDSRGREQRWRVVPRVARAGFLLVPTLEHLSDVANYLQGTTDNPLRAFQFEAPPTQDEFWDHVEYKLFEVTDQPLLFVPAGLVERGVFDRPAAAMDSAQPLELINLPEGPVLQVHANGAVRFDLGREARRLTFQFGLRPGAYTGDGHSAGVEFSVEQASGPGPGITVWRRRLDPLRVAADRGPQTATIELPGPGPSSVTLRTTAVPGPDNSWDWSYFARVKFTGGAAP